MQNWCVGFLLAALGLTWQAPALANGRYPRADQLLVDPSNPKNMALRATYGVLVSSDRGRSWKWLCEGGVGYSGEVDPALVMFEGGSIVAGSPRDLRVSQADGCSWQSPFDGDAKENFIDATLDGADPTNAWMVSRRLDGSHVVRVVAVHRADPLPVQVGEALGEDLSPLTLEVAPSLPDRIYVSAILADLTSVLLRSDDRGQTWRRSSISDAAGLPAYIAAVDPHDADRVYVRLDGEATDALWVSDDGGGSFREVFSFDADMLGFALAPDGATAAVGGPGAGLFVADTTSLSFEKSPAALTSLSCLKWTDDALFACADEKADGFTLAESTDAGRRFEPIFHLEDLTPLSCEASTDVGSVCPAAWPAVARSLGIGADGASAGNTAGGGCSCTLPPSRVSRMGSLALLATLGGVLRRRLRGPGRALPSTGRHSR